MIFDRWLPFKSKRCFVPGLGWLRFELPSHSKARSRRREPKLPSVTTRCPVILPWRHHTLTSSCRDVIISWRHHTVTSSHPIRASQHTTSDFLVLKWCRMLHISDRTVIYKYNLDDNAFFIIWITIFFILVVLRNARFPLFLDSISGEYLFEFFLIFMCVSDCFLFYFCTKQMLFWILCNDDDVWSDFWYFSCWVKSAIIE